MRGIEIMAPKRCPRCLKGDLKRTGGDDVVETFWCPECGAERVYALKGGECENRQYIPGAFCIKKDRSCDLCEGSKPLPSGCLAYRFKIKV